MTSLIYLVCPQIHVIVLFIKHSHTVHDDSVNADTMQQWFHRIIMEPHAAHTCSPSSQEAEAGGSPRVQGYSVSLQLVWDI